MSKNYPTWKYLLIIVVILFGLLVALPNWYGKSPTVQMQFPTPEAAATAAGDITKQLNDANLAPVRWK